MINISRRLSTSFHWKKNKNKKNTWAHKSFRHYYISYSEKVAGLMQEESCLFTLLPMCLGAEMSMVILPVLLSPLWFNLISCSRWNTLRTIWTKANIHLDGKCDRTRGELGAWLILLPRSCLYFITKVTEVTTAFCKNRTQSV